jgi:hypothetical protein
MDFPKPMRDSLAQLLRLLLKILWYHSLDHAYTPFFLITMRHHPSRFNSFSSSSRSSQEKEKNTFSLLPLFLTIFQTHSSPSSSARKVR